MHAGKVLIGFALIWIIIGCIIGFVMGINQKAYLAGMEQYANDGNLAGFWTCFEAWKAHSVAHSHGLCLSMVAFLVGLAMTANVIRDFRILVMCLLIIGVSLASISDLFKAVPGIVIGDSLFIIGLCLAFAFLIKSKDED